MEIILAVLLLFGGFTLGSITADKGDGDPPSTLAVPNADGATDSYQVKQSMRQDDPTRCPSDGSVTYRDLTVSYAGQKGPSVTQAGECHGGRDCSYNPTAFPPSAVQGCTNAAIAGRNGAAMEVKCPNE